MRIADDDLTDEAAVAAWAGSGAMHLTGPADGPPLGPPAPLVERLLATTAVLARRTAQIGREVAVDPLARLVDRAAIAGLERNGQVSCGGGTRLLPTADGWLAVALVRDDDLDLLPAWLGIDPADGPSPPWDEVAGAVAGLPTRSLVERGALLGLPVGGLPPSPPVPPSATPSLAPLPCRATRLGANPPPTDALAQLVVADLSSLWAGPLCGSLLVAAGAEVLKVESTHRPDGARRGPEAFFDRLNAGKRSVALDLTTADGRAALGALLERVDVVIEGSRPRALEQLGIDAHRVLLDGRPRVWVSITGHGREGADRDRVGFGDDAAVAGGLVVRHGGRPNFCADAVADPATGMVAAAAAVDALVAGGTWMLDVGLAGVAAHLAGPTLAVPAGVEAATPPVRAAGDPGPQLGADTDEVLDELGIRP